MKRERSWGLKEVRCALRLATVWIAGMGAVGVVLGQGSSWETWEAGGVIWCGQSGMWSLTLDADSLAIHQLQATEAGRQVLWGCPTQTSWPTVDSSWAAVVHWSQQVSGSNANRSSVLWAAPPSNSPEESAWLLATSLDAGWLDVTGGVRAGETGSDDPLHCHVPGLPSWAVAPSCHQWSDPFMFEGTWEWTSAGTWNVQARDTENRSSQWVDTSMSIGVERPPCLGLDVTHTSSNGSKWAFGWRPVQASSSTSEHVNAWHLSDAQHVEGLMWPPDSAAGPLNIRQLGDGPPCLHAIPEATACDNVWHWTLPNPVDEGGFVSFHHRHEFVELWRDGTDLVTEGGLAFTEIMADPTPALHAPESTYLEVLNVSDVAIDPERLQLEDSGILHEVEWVIPPNQGLVLPGERWVLVESTSPWIASALDGVWVARVVGWNGLRDDGESLTLRGPQGAIETLRYFPSWWENSPQDGVALSSQHPLACDLRSTWHPDPDGASPGRPATFESAQPPQSTRLEMGLRRTPFGTLEWSPHPEWNPDQPPWVTLTWLDSALTLPLTARWTDQGDVVWEAPWALKTCHEVAIELDSVLLCQADGLPMTRDTVWHGHRPPELGDVELTEILPVRHPVTKAEFLEWTNVSPDTLMWGDRTWPPDVALVQSSQPRTAFRVWLGPTWWSDSTSCLWDWEADLTLSNEGGMADLTDAWGQTVASSSYSRCGHSDRLGESQGRSMERLPHLPRLGENATSRSGDAWRSAPGSDGMSPGRPTSWPASWDVDSVRPAFGVKDAKWITTVPPGADMSWWNSEAWSPPTVWESEWHQGVQLAVANWGPAEGPRPPTFLQAAPWKAPSRDWGAIVLADQGPEWNEVLASPHDGWNPFVELMMIGEGAWSRDWVWSSDPWAHANDFVPMSDITWWFEASEETCLATCPHWVEKARSRCLPANLPSLHGERLLALRTENQESQVDLRHAPEPPWSTSGDGISWARLPGSSLWSHTPPHLESTPGTRNGPSLMNHESGDEASLRCSPRTIQPAGSEAWDTVELTWNSPDGDAFDVEYGVCNLQTGIPVQSFQASMVGANLSWVWRGTNDQNAIQPPGSYVGFVQWHNTTEGGRGRNQCLIALAPH